MARRALLAAMLLLGLALSNRGPARLHAAAESAGWLLPPGACPSNRDAPREAYVPQPGDIIFYDHRSLQAAFLYALAHTGKPYHAGIVVNLSDGRPAVLEAGPYDLIHVFLMDAQPQMRTHEGEIWVRRLRTPLTAEQSACLTRFALAQTGKRFALCRIILEATPLHAHGPLRARLFGSSRTDRHCWFCSELVVAAAAVAGIVDPHVLKPNTLYPRDLFYDRHCDLKPWWEAPRRWMCDP